MDAGSCGASSRAQGCPRPPAGRQSRILAAGTSAPLAAARPSGASSAPSPHRGLQLPALRTARRPGSLSDEREIDRGLGASCVGQAQSPRLGRPPSRQSHLWGERRRCALMKPPAVPAAGRAPVCVPVYAVHTSSAHAFMPAFGQRPIRREQATVCVGIYVGGGVDACTSAGLSAGMCVCEREREAGVHGTCVWECMCTWC